MRDGEDAPIFGVALAVLGLEELNSRYVVHINLLGDHGYAMIATSGGDIIAHRDEGTIGGLVSEQTMSYLSLITDGGSSAVFETSRDGITFMAFAERSHYTDWFAVVLCPVSEFYESTNYLTIINTVIAVLLILVQAGIIWIVVRGITNALTETVQYSEAVSKGSLDTTLPVERDDELGVLAHSLRDMVGKLKNMINIAERKAAEAQAASETIMAGITYASKIQSDLLPKNQAFDNAFSDYSIIWKPRDIVGGDIFWLKNFEAGSILCVCDCTGHGAPGAMLTMLVVSAFEDIVNENNCHDTAGVIWQLEQRLVSGFSVDAVKNHKTDADIHDGCDLAVIFIKTDGSVSFSSANLPVFICDGKEVRHIKGQRLYIGDGLLKSKKEIQTTYIGANPNNKFYIASDGLFDQPGGNGVKTVPFGYGPFKDILLKNHDNSQDAISGKIWDAFEDYRGAEPRVDDFELITFKL
jgi:serine phosphatase RsbU (regulator of sigma subunit)